MSVRPVLLHVDGVVALGKDGRVVVGVLDVHVDEHARGEDRRALAWVQEVMYQLPTWGCSLSGI